MNLQLQIKRTKSKPVHNQIQAQIHLTAVHNAAMQSN